MDSSFAEIDDIRLAIGDLCIAWAHLEDGYYTLVTYQFGAYDGEASDALRNEMDIRRMASFQKAVALARPPSPTGPHIIALADMIDGPLRAARNHYVHDPIYSWGTHFARLEYRTRSKGPKAKPQTTFSRNHAIKKGEIELLVRCVKLAEDYAGAIIRVLNGELFGDYDDVDGKPDVDTAADKLKAALAEYATLTKDLPIQKLR